MTEIRATLMRCAARLLRRDLGSGRLLVMLLATIIAVTSTVAVNLLVARVNRVMLAESSALLAGDLALDSRAPLSAHYSSQASALGLATSRQVRLRSVVSAAERLQLVQLKAVDEAYPLAGRLRTARVSFGALADAARGPISGEVWADQRLVQLLDLTVGDTITVGRLDLRLGAILVVEPDRGGDVFALAPRLMMNLADLPATGLIVAGTRAEYRLLVAGSASAIDRYRAALELAPGDELVDPKTSRPEMRSAFVQAERFLTLAAFTGALLAAVGIALAATAYADYHEDTVGILKTLGLTRGEVVFVLGAELCGLALLATLAGDCLAVAVHQLLVARYVPDLASLGAGIPLAPLLHGALVAFVSLAGFALPALAQLGRKPVIAILNHNDHPHEHRRAAHVTRAAVMVLAAIAIAPWHLGDATLIAAALGGMLASALVLALAARVVITLLARSRARTAMSWRFGLANVARRGRLSLVQTTAIGLGVAIVLLLSLVRDDLLVAWQERLPPGTPNQFLINIQPDEVAAVRDFLGRRGQTDADFFPMIRGRLAAINDTPVVAVDYDTPRARRLARREFNLSWARRMKPDNRLVDGRWWSDPAADEFSVEQGIADLLGIEIGDRLTFSVADRSVSATVTSLRAVDWENFQVNFFVVGTPLLLTDLPATWITSFYLPASARDIMPPLVRAFPSVTVFDVDALMLQVRRVMNRVAGALTWVFGFALAAGLLVLVAAVQTTQRERALDAVLLKTLGADRRFITLTTLTEFVVLGAVAGVVGSVGALATAWLLADRVLDIAYRPDPAIPLVGIAGAVAGAAVTGIIALRRTHRRAVTATLRELG